MFLSAMVLEDYRETALRNIYTNWHVWGRDIDDTEPNRWNINLQFTDRKGECSNHCGYHGK